jgi:transposase InsO family protein
VNRLRDWCRPAHVPRVATRRGDAWQNPLRQREHGLRLDIADLCTWAAQQGHSRLQIADLLRLTPRTLRDWCQQAQFHLQAQTLGRPVLHSSCAERNAVIALIDELGPRVGVPTLRACFPHLPPAELADLLKRYRRVWRQRYHECLHVLRWPLPGAVWAMDFAEAPQPIDGLYRYLLAVRDLASGQQLLWLPLATATARETIPALEPLFLLHGPPLVLKTDNGSPFLAGDVLAFLAAWGVEQLFSPPRMPRYNGAIEAGIGSLKTRTEQEATRHGHPTQWTWDDAEAARAQANATARPQGDTGPTPEEAWTAHRPISASARALFRAAVAQQRQEICVQHGCQKPDAGTPAARVIDRQAIPRALVEHGFLLYRRRRIPLPFPKRKAANIR